MSEPRKCPACGAQIPFGAPAGQCVKCLLGFADTIADPGGATEPNSPLPPEGDVPTPTGTPPSGGSDAPMTKSIVPPLRGKVPSPRGFGGFEFLSVPKAGGMGVVYRARQVSLNRVVALKMIRAGSLATVEDVRRFRTEAENAANLDHPNI